MQAGEPYGTQSGLSTCEQTVQRPTIVHEAGLNKPGDSTVRPQGKVNSGVYIVVVQVRATEAVIALSLHKQ